MRTIKPTPHSICVECNQPIGDEPYHYTKHRGWPPTFIHKACYEKLLPRNQGGTKDESTTLQGMSR